MKVTAQTRADLKGTQQVELGTSPLNVRSGTEMKVHDKVNSLKKRRGTDFTHGVPRDITLS